MKNLKKIALVVLIAIVAGMVLNVNASCVPWYWTINGKDMTNGNTSTTSSLERCSEDTITLKLNNYNGEGFELECLGTCPSTYKFVIELTGDNVITDDTMGINFKDYNGKIEFKGDGTLSINAPKPISYENYVNTMIIKPASNVYTDKEEVVKEEIEGTTKTEETTTTGSTTDNNLVLYIVFGAYALLSLVIIIILAVSLNKKNKKEEVI